MGWTRKDLLSMRALEAGEIVLLVDTAASLQEIAGARDQEGPGASRQDGRQPLLRVVHADAHLVRDRREMALGGRHQLLRQRIEHEQG